MWVGLCVFFTWLPPWYSAGFTVRGVMVGRATRSPLLVMMMSDMPRGREVKWWSAKVVPFLALSEEEEESRDVPTASSIENSAFDYYRIG